MAALAGTLERLDRESWEQYLDELRFLDWLARTVPGETLTPFYDDHPGHPLGKGFPLGATLRRDGETHLAAWARIVRQDGVCAYCGERKRDMTVDHIVPKVGGGRGVHSWINYTAACGKCNRRKGSHKTMLETLLERTRLTERYDAKR